MSKPSLAEALAAPQLPYTQRCKVGDVLSTHEDAEHIRAALADPNWSTKAIARVLRQFGINIAPTTLLKHRHGDCRC